VRAKCMYFVGGSKATESEGVQRLKGKKAKQCIKADKQGGQEKRAIMANVNGIVPGARQEDEGGGGLTTRHGTGGGLSHRDLRREKKKLGYQAQHKTVKASVLSCAERRRKEART